MKHADILIWCARKNFPAPLKIELTLSHKEENILFFLLDARARKGVRQYMEIDKVLAG